jgi:hypothetical protein
MKKIALAVLIAVLTAAIISCGSDGVKFEDGEKQQWTAAGFTIEQAKEWKKSGFDFMSAIQCRQGNISTQEAVEWRNAGFDAISSIQWKRSGFSLQEASKWQGAGISYADAKQWKSAGVSPEESKGWQEIGLNSVFAKRWVPISGTPEKTRELFNSGFDKGSSDEIICMKNLGFDLNEIIDFKTDEIKCKTIKKWKNAGFTVEDMRMLKNAGLTELSSVNNLKPLIEAGFTINEIASLLEGGYTIYDLKMAIPFKEAGFDANMIAELKKEDIYIGTINEWAKNGFEVNDAVAWIKLGVRGDQHYIARSWTKDAGLEHGQVKVLVENGFNINYPGKYIDYKKIGIDYDDAIIFKKANFEPIEIKNMEYRGEIMPGEILAWINSGFDKANIEEWMPTKLTSEDCIKLKEYGYQAKDVIIFKKAGFEPSDLMVWSDNGESNEVACKWVNAGIRYNDYKKWAGAGFDVTEAYQFSKGGFQPEEAKGWKENGYSTQESVLLKKAGFTAVAAKNLTLEEKLLYGFNFKGLYLGMDEMEAAEKLDEIARQTGCSRAGGVVYNRNRIALISVTAKDEKVNYISFHPMLANIPFNDYAMDNESARTYIKENYGIDMKGDDRFKGNKIEVSLNQFMLCFEVL